MSRSTSLLASIHRTLRFPQVLFHPPRNLLLKLQLLRTLHLHLLSNKIHVHLVRLYRLQNLSRTLMLQMYPTSLLRIRFPLRIKISNLPLVHSNLNLLHSSHHNLLLRLHLNLIQELPTRLVNNKDLYHQLLLLLSRRTDSKVKPQLRPNLRIINLLPVLKPPTSPRPPTR